MKPIISIIFIFFFCKFTCQSQTVMIDMDNVEKIKFTKNVANTARIEIRNNNSNVFIGDSSGYNTSSSGIHNTGLGDKALFTNNQGDYNTAVGSQALYKINNSSHGMTAVGYQALYNHNQAEPNTSVGYQASFLSSAGGYNTSVGYQAHYTAGGQYNIAMGYRALYSNNSLAMGNIGIGYEALLLNVENDFNTAVGYFALRSCVYGSNTAIGALAMQFTNQASQNVAVGAEALRFNTTGGQNTAVGMNSLWDNIAGNGNAAFGFEALRKNRAGTNAAFGAYAMRENINGTGNTAMGYSAMYNTTSERNTAVGFNALDTNIGGNSNTAIGWEADVSLSNLTNASAFGAQAVVGASNCMVLGNNVNVGIGISIPTSKLHVVGNGLFTGTVTASCGVLTCSDVRYKKNILPITSALASLINMQGVRYDLKTEEYGEKHFDNRPQIGLIAQDVEVIFPELVFTDAEGYKAIDYSKLTPVLIEAIKELKRENDILKNNLDEIIKEIDCMKKLMETK